MKTCTVMLSLLLLLSSAAFAADVTGVWQITISSRGPDGDANQDKGMASLKQSGETITGWIGPDETRQIPVEGTIKDNKVVLKASVRPDRAMTFDLTFNGEKLVGSVARTGDERIGTAEFVKSSK